MASLITDKSKRLCSKRYLLKDAAIATLAMRAGRQGMASSATNSVGSQDSSVAATEQDLARRYVFPYDAEDIKAHKFFKGLPWERLHLMPPPFIPKLSTEDDTRYFDDEEAVFDSWEGSQTSSSPSEDEDANDDVFAPSVPAVAYTSGRMAATTTLPDRATMQMQHMLDRFHPCVQHKALEWISTPYDTSRWKAIEAEVDQLVATGLLPSDGEILRQFVQCYGKKEKKRPRDRLLRDRETKKVVMELRKRNAFLGYTWRRMRHPPFEMSNLNKNKAGDIAAMRAFHRDRFWQR
ncbi:serine/threonine-protein kinase cbk1 [Niveomyces insectorum RCEF 264]|uniref:non-specific serine/threonine protein kinase n=1 Tax=Niveomyces insectorum RCEF 264 TaxID=1081102 RepID=A0A162MQF1_9HYPO|nr:serine/threonine-protein kinase cbk1 [Niveomyces insectorum RCEF 264]